MTQNITTSARAQALADQLEQANAAVIAAVEACDDATWRSVRGDEGWPVAFIAWHIGNGHLTIMGLISAIAEGRPLPPVTRAMLDAINAESLTQHGTCSKQEALAVLRQNGAVTADAIRGLSDAQLDRTAALELFGGTPLSVQQLIERVLVGHARQHLASMQAAG